MFRTAAREEASMETKELIQTLVSLVAIGGFLFGVFQYRQAQRWKRLEYAASQLRRLDTKPELTLATIFLDISIRGVPLPEKLWKYAGTEVFQHDCQKMYALMKSRYEDNVEYFIYNDAFERLFAYLEQIYACIEMGLIQAKDVRALRWLVKSLSNPTWAAEDEKDVFLTRAHRQGYHDVIKLLRLLDQMDRPSLLRISSSDSAAPSPAPTA
jgi:hypothetical protein